jgi:hypothetical protein
VTTRLTKSDREQMAKALVRHRFHVEAEALMRASAELFAAVYDERHDEQTQKLMRQLQRRHKNAFAQTDDLYVNANGMRVNVGGIAVGSHRTVSWTTQVPTRPVLNGSRYGEIEAVSAELSARIAAFALDCKAFAEKLAPAYNKALGALAQFTTGKKLAEEWPEAMPVIGNLIPANDRALPVVQTAAINDEFGLPPSEVEAA